MRRLLHLLTPLCAALMLWGCQAPPQAAVDRIIAKPAPRNLEAMGWVTGLHIHFLEDIGYEFRVLEMDGSASVALNPIYLYLLVTDNVPGDSGQTRMVSLPQASKIERVRFYGSDPRLEIDVLLDRMDEAGRVTTWVPATFEITANIADGKLRGDIEVVVRKPAADTP